MEKLRVQAHHAGGEVLSHLGNHEWMNVIGKTIRLIEIFMTHVMDSQVTGGS